MPTLRITLPDHKGEITHVLAGARITVGRRPENTIQIIDCTVSGHHAEFIAVNGHYRLHDLGSTNLTRVDGQPITDFHLHGKCKVSFGTVECLFSLENATPEAAGSEVVPTRSELEYLRRENLDLLSKISALQKQVDILSSARLVTSETTQLGVPQVAHRRVSQERDDLKAANAKLETEIRNLKEDVSGLTRAREAMRVAWETVKGELGAAQELITALGGQMPSTNAASPPPEVVKLEPAADSNSGRVAIAPPGSDASPKQGDHRALATLVMSGPPLLTAVTESLEKLSAGNTDASLRSSIAKDIAELNRHAATLDGHPLQRVASAMQAVIQRDESEEMPRSAIRALQQGAALLLKLLDPAHLKRARSLPMPSALVVDDDPDVISTVTQALGEAGITASSCPNSQQALERLSGTPFDLIFLDVGLPDSSGIDICARIR